MTAASRAKKPAAIFPLMAGGLGLSLIAVLSYRFFINPYLAKKRREQSQNFADNLWNMQHEQKPDGDNDSQ